MSIAMLSDTSKSHEILDDLESMYWTFLFSALHRFPHEGSPDMGMFDEAFPHRDAAGVTGKMKGGSRKKVLLLSFSSTITFACVPLNDLMVTLSERLTDYYLSLDDLKRKQEAVKRSSSKANISALKKAEKKYNKIHEKLSKPSTWRDMFHDALMSKGWTPADAVQERLYPEHTEEEEVRMFEFKTQSMFQSNARTTDDDALPVPTSNDQDLPSDIEDGKEGRGAYTSDEEDGEVGDDQKSESATLPEQSTYSSGSEDYTDGSPSPTPLPGSSGTKRTREDFEHFVAGSSGGAPSKRSKSELSYVAPTPSMILLPAGTVKTRSGRQIIAPRRYQSGDAGTASSGRQAIPSRRYRTSGDAMLGYERRWEEPWPG